MPRSVYVSAQNSISDSSCAAHLARYVHCRCSTSKKLLSRLSPERYRGSRCGAHGRVNLIRDRSARSVVCAGRSRTTVTLYVNASLLCTDARRKRLMLCARWRGRHTVSMHGDGVFAKGLLAWPSIHPVYNGSGTTRRYHNRRHLHGWRQHIPARQDRPQVELPAKGAACCWCGVRPSIQRATPTTNTSTRRRV